MVDRAAAPADVAAQLPGAPLAAARPLVVYCPRGARSLRDWAAVLAAVVAHVRPLVDVGVLLADRASGGVDALALRKRALAGDEMLGAAVAAAANGSSNGTTGGGADTGSSNLAPYGMFDAILSAVLVLAITTYGFCELAKLQTPTAFAGAPRKQKMN